MDKSYFKNIQNSEELIEIFETGEYCLYLFNVCYKLTNTTTKRIQPVYISHEFIASEPERLETYLGNIVSHEQDFKEVYGIVFGNYFKDKS